MAMAWRRLFHLTFSAVAAALEFAVLELMHGAAGDAFLPGRRVLGTRFESAYLCFQLGLLGLDVLFENMSGGSASMLHNTTSFGYGS
jgi:hypothetical protein